MNSTLPAILPVHIDDAMLMALSSSNPHLKMERTKKGDLVVMSPSGTRVSGFQLKLASLLNDWVNEFNHGIAFDSQAGFRLPDGSVLSPDVSWVSTENWDTLQESEKDGFAPLCPEFVVEVISPSDSQQQQIEKMGDWMKNGAQLAWLIDPKKQHIWIFRANHENLEFHESFNVELSGETVLPDFTVNPTSLLIV